MHARGLVAAATRYSSPIAPVLTGRAAGISSISCRIAIPRLSLPVSRLNESFRRTEVMRAEIRRLFSTSKPEAEAGKATGTGSTGSAGSSGTASTGGTSFFSNPLQWWRENNAHLKAMFKQYGYFAVATYLSVYVTTLLSLWALVSNKFIQGPDVNAWINKWSVKKAVWADEIHLRPGFINFATAWILTKPTEPVRLVVTIALVPFLAKRLPPNIMKLFGVVRPEEAAGAATAAVKKAGQTVAAAGQEAARRSGLL
jgi:hypothetical protein